MGEIDLLGELLKLGGRRSTPPPLRASGARAAARAEWVRVVHRRRFHRRAFIVAAVGAAVLGAVASQRMLSPAGHKAALAVATVRAIAETPIAIERSPRERLTGALDMTLTSGDRLETADGRAALILVGGFALRMDRNTAAVVIAVSV
jgi:hypothetical protein